jgi:riboflavin kinase/FMN adenylyltransferase
MSTDPKTDQVANEREVALVIGNFDGVHRGHQALVRYTVELAQKRGLSPKIMTFDPHPAQLLSGKAPMLLTRLERKLELLQRILPTLEILVQPFDEQFSMLSPRQFVERILVSKLRVRELVVGKNFRFGRDRAGSSEDLVRLGKEFGFGAVGFTLSGDEQGSFSSSRIRRFIAEGDLTSATTLLGRPHCLIGSVVRGDGRGKSLGFATANLEQVEEQRPPAGVYAGVAQFTDSNERPVLCSAAIHIGPRPTVDRGETIEAHLLGQTGDMYGRTLRLHLVERLRDLVRFDGVDALKTQIALDVDATVRATAPLLSKSAVL